MLRDKTLVAFSPDDIALFSVTRLGVTVTVKKDPKGTWIITEPFEARADPEQIRDILDFIADEKAQGFADKAADKKALGLDPPTITLTLVDSDGATSRLLIGKPAAAGSYWAMRDANPWAFMVSDKVKAKLTVSADFIMDKSLFSYTVSEVDSFTVKSPDGALSVMRDKDGWKIAKPESTKGDKNTIDTLLLDLKEMKFEKVVEKPAKSLGRYGLDAPTMAFSITYAAADGKEHKAELRIKRGNGDTSYGYLSEGDFIFSIATETIATLSPTFSALKNKALLTFDSGDVEEVTIVKGNETYAFNNKKGQWKMTKPEKKEVDAESMKYLILGIEDISYADILAEKKDNLKKWGLDKPEITIAVIGKDSKEIGTIALGKAKEEGEGKYVPAVSSSLDKVYKVNADLVDDLESDITTTREGR